MAVKRWVGGAVAVKDKWTITVAGTWASGDTVTISIGNKDLIITLGASASTVVADIAAEIVAAINAADNTAPGTGFTWNYGGQQFMEFKDIVATVNSAVVTVTAVNAGEPIGLVVTEVTAGDGTATEANSVVATGPEFIDNADNYAGGVLPVDNDDLYFDTGAVSAKYGLTYFRANNIDLNVYITGDWTGQLGLPAVRTVTGGSYAEYRQRYFQFRGGSKVFRVLPGRSGATNQGALYVDFQDQASVSIAILAGRGSGTAPTIFLAGSDATTGHTYCHVAAGAVSIEPDDAPTGATKYFLPLELIVGTGAGAANDAIVYIGKNARIAKANDIRINSGTTFSEAPTDDTVDTCAVIINGGSFEAAGVGNFDDFTVAAGGTLYISSEGTHTTGGVITLNGGVLDCRRGIGQFGLQVIDAYKGSSIFDPDGLNVASFNALGCKVTDLTLDLPANQNFALTPA